MEPKSQTNPRLPLKLALGGTVLLALCPCAGEAAAIIWGQAHGFTGKALRDGLDFWAGGFLVSHQAIGIVFDPVAYNGFLRGLFGKLPTHLWSYPPSYLLLACAFTGLSAWHTVLVFDAASLLLLLAVLRLSGQNWWLIAAVLLSPAAAENLLEGQNAALLTALIGGGVLLLAVRPRLGGVLVGFASIKPQLGLVLPLYLLRRAPTAFAYAVLAATALITASLFAFGPAPWQNFFTIISPAMSRVLITGQPPEFAGGLISIFAAARPLGIPIAFAAQAAVTLSAILLAARTRSPAVILLLAALASPYLHGYDLVGTALAIALLVRERLAAGFAPGEPVIFFIGWFLPGGLNWLPAATPLAPLVLLLLLAIALRRGPVPVCDSSPAQPGSPVSSAGRSPIPAHLDRPPRHRRRLRAPAGSARKLCRSGACPGQSRLCRCERHHAPQTGGVWGVRHG
jgi:hypothetical protein